MSQTENSKSRRSFLKTLGALGAGSMCAAVAPLTNASGKQASASVPKRLFGKTGEKCCPQKIQIGRVLREAFDDLA